MRKLLASVFALAFIVNPAQAEILKNLKTSGSVDVYGFRSMNDQDALTNTNSADDVTSNVNVRTSFGMMFDLLDDVSAGVTMTKNDNNWGDNAATTAGTGAVGANNGDDLNTIASNVRVHEAYVHVKNMMGHLNAKVGRQFLGNEGDLNGYFGKTHGPAQPVNSIEGVLLECTHMMTDDGGNLSFFYGKSNDVGGVGAESDVDYKSVDYSTKLFGQMLGVYVKNLREGAEGTPGGAGDDSDNLWVIGLKHKASELPFGLSLDWEAAFNKGTNANGGGVASDAAGTKHPKYKGWGFLANLRHKWGMDAIGNFDWGVHVAYGSGDDNSVGADNDNHGFTTIASDYRPGLIYGNLDTIGGGNTLFTAIGGTLTAAPTGGYGYATANGANNLNNRFIWSLGMKWMNPWWEKLTVGLDYYSFAYSRIVDSTAGLIGQKNIGTEADLTLNWMHSDNVNVTFGYGQFYPGAMIDAVVFPGNSGGQVSPVRQLSTKFHVSF